jgi:hypothetical protein
MGNATKEAGLYWRCESRRPKVVQMVRDARCRMQDGRKKQWHSGKSKT